MKSIPASELRPKHRIEIDGKFRYVLTSVDTLLFGQRALIVAETTTGKLLSFAPYETAFVC